ncbi:ribonuclease kappa-like [Convolutriloba macropyga]|uniref:ribonuclease kappa-like n=1 Tax=Convolutriloba macropyga TaxID=536237 RepID=UPI003F523002
MAGAIFCSPTTSFFCAFIGLWGLVMLPLMGVFFWIHAVTFIEDVSYDEPPQNFTKDGLEDAYETVAVNMFIATGVYLLGFLLCICQFVNRKTSLIPS